MSRKATPFTSFGCNFATKLDKMQVYGVRTDEEIAGLGELRTKLYGSAGVH